MNSINRFQWLLCRLRIRLSLHVISSVHMNGSNSLFQTTHSRPLPHHISPSVTSHGINKKNINSLYFFHLNRELKNVCSDPLILFLFLMLNFFCALCMYILFSLFDGVSRQPPSLKTSSFFNNLHF